MLHICKIPPDKVMKNSQKNSHMIGTSEMFTFVACPPSQVCLMPHFPQRPLNTRTWSVAWLFVPSACEYMYSYVSTNNSRLVILRTIFNINETQIKESVSKVQFQTSKNLFYFFLSKLCRAVAETFSHWCLWSNILTNTEKLHTSLDWSTTTEKQDFSLQSAFRIFCQYFFKVFDF